MIAETMVAGENFEVEFEILLNNSPEDITAYTAKISMNDTSPDGKLLQTWDDSSAEITRSNSAGKVTLLIPAGITNAYKFKHAYMDLLLQKSDGGIRSVALKITLDRGVTR